MVNAPFRECVVLSLASFRKRGISLSGDPCQRYVGGSVARGFIFLSVLLVYPTFFCVVALFSAVVPVAVEASRRPSACLPPVRSERIVRRGGYALRAVFLPYRQARVARHHGWYGPGGLFCWF